MKPKVLSCFLIALECIIAGCSISGHLADGTETGNPEIAACIKKMASAAFNALDSNNSWKPADFLNAQAPGPLAKKMSQPVVRPLGLRKMQSTKSDTVIVSDTVEIVYDTIFVVDTIHVLDTVKINKVLFVSDTVVDTVLSKTGNDTLHTFIKRQVQDSVTIFDNVVVADTIIQPRKKVIIKLYQYRDGAPIAFIRADSMWIADSILQNNSGMNVLPLNNSSANAVGPINWGVTSVTYDIATASPSYTFVSMPLQDTMVIPGNKDNFSVVSSESFMARTKIINGIVVELVQYDRLDSILSVMRYYPLAIDSVESLSVAYSIDPDANISSSSDDVLMGINQQMAFRLGPIGLMKIAITPEASEKGLGLLKSRNPLVSIVLQNTRGLHGIFEGTIDPINGLSGVYEFGGKKYQIHCDRDLKATMTEITN